MKTRHYPSFMTGYPDQPAQRYIVDYPASYHNGTSGFSFADGHAEIKKWGAPRTTPNLNDRFAVPHRTWARE